MVNVGESKLMSKSGRTEADHAIASQWASRLMVDPVAANRRRRRIERVREAIDAADYENALKLSVAIDRLLEQHVIGR